MGAHCVSLRDERDGKSGETKRIIGHGASRHIPAASLGHYAALSFVGKR